MLKRIAVEQLVPGMHIQELCGSWMEHPFWRTSFMLKDPADLRRIRDSGISEVWIDTAKGLDLTDKGADTQTEPQTEPESEAEFEQRFVAAAARAAPADQPVPLARELAQAARICARSRDAVVSMFGEARLGRAIDSGSARPLVEEIAGSVARNPGALINLARLKRADDYTYMHSVAVCALMIALARQLELDEQAVREAGLAGLLHDVGKIAIPEHVLNKPGKLEDAEFKLVRYHPQAGHEMLMRGSGVPEIALDVCLHHHEKVDGSGYPHRLKDAEISLYAKMGAVCDVYDAITSDRPYKKGWDPSQSLRKMAEWSKGHFDERVFQSFVKSVGIYPIGSLVRLRSGRLGVIVDQSAGSLLTPTVRVFFSTKSGTRITPQVLDLSRPQAQDAIEAREDPTEWNFPDLAALSHAAD